MSLIRWTEWASIIPHLVIYTSNNYVSFASSKYSAVLLHYSTVNFQLNPHKIHPIACPLGWGMGCNLWFNTDLYFGSFNAVLYEISCYIGLRYNGTGLSWCPVMGNLLWYFAFDDNFFSSNSPDDIKDKSTDYWGHELFFLTEMNCKFMMRQSIVLK